MLRCRPESSADGSSGGCARLAIIDKNGVERAEVLDL
jgi:hypothetical protein